MAKTYEGPLLSGQLSKIDEYNWTDPLTGRAKPLRSFKVLVSYPDGTRTMESVAFPDGYAAPDVEIGQTYCFPASVRVNKKKMTLNWTAHPTIPPFPAPQLG
jgi:hypothetical protein